MALLCSPNGVGVRHYSDKGLLPPSVLPAAFHLSPLVGCSKPLTPQTRSSTYFPVPAQAISSLKLRLKAIARVLNPGGEPRAPD